MLAVTSYATRTSPVIRGVWVLGNIFGAPPPPPLPNVPALDESTVAASLPMRERLAAHRSNAVCASCHRTIDPVGFSLESFNAVGRGAITKPTAYRSTRRERCRASASSAASRASKTALLSRPELFAGTLTEKLLTFALGRGVEYYDAPAVRKIVRDAGKDGYRFSSLILGIVKSTPFQMRKVVMIITKKAIPRRTFLKGAQAALALPLLDAMIPAATAGRRRRPSRCRGSASSSSRWDAITRDGPRRARRRSTSCRPSCPRSNRSRTSVTVITNTRLQNAYPGTHDTSNAAFLSAAFAKHTESSDYYLGTTVDQIAARQIGRETQLASLELAMDLNPLAGVCNNGYACVYQNCLSWSSPTTPLPSEAHPRIVFERLFGEGGNAAARRAALRSRASLLDSFSGDIARLKQRVGIPDRVRVDQYLDSIREIERQIQRAEAATTDNTMPDLDRPVGVPAAFADHAKLMFDLQILAFQADITRVVTFQLTREQSNRTYPEIGVPDPHHPTSHHGNDPEKIAKIAKINTFHVSLFAEFLAEDEGHARWRRLAARSHASTCTAAAWAIPACTITRTFRSWSRAAPRTGLKGGRHIKYDKGTPLANLHLTLLDRVGVHLDSFGDSSGKIEDLFDPRRAVSHVQGDAHALPKNQWTRSPGARARPAQRWAPNARRSPTPRSNATRRASARSSRRGVDVNAAQVDGTTALHWAAYHDDAETAALLVRAGANVNAVNRYGVPPLSLACSNGSGGVVKLLLDAGADANATMKGGETVLMMAARSGNLEAVNALLARGARHDARERRGQTALMWAAAEGHAAVVRALIDAGADINATLDSGFTPFFFAVREGHIDVVRAFLEAGVDVNATLQRREGRPEAQPCTSRSARAPVRCCSRCRTATSSSRSRWSTLAPIRTIGGQDSRRSTRSPGCESRIPATSAIRRRSGLAGSRAFSSCARS